MPEKSDFSEFHLPLSNNALLSGIQYVPSPNTAQARTKVSAKPLLIMLHGGGCNAHYFDLDSFHSVIPVAKAHGVPIVSIHRPCYGDSTSVLPLSSDSSFHQESGRWLHQYILPALWQGFGKPNSCTCIVLIGHSLASAGIIVAASLYARDERHTYPLAAIVLSGWGIVPNATSQRQRLRWTAQEMRENRSTLMLSDPVYEAGDHALLAQHLNRQSSIPPPEEATEVVNGQWAEIWREYAYEIDVPIMYSIGEHDWLWEASAQNVQAFASCFPKCPRFDGSLVLGAPHAIDWSYYSRGWQTRYVGFALEIAWWHKAKRSC